MRVLPPTAREAGNSMTPVSAFPNAANHFDNLFAAAGECPPFIDSVPPILTEMLQAVRFAFRPFFCSCAASDEAPACFFHLAFLGRVSHSYIIDVVRLERDLRTHFVVSKSVAGALSRLGVRSARVWHAGLRCFFVALSIGLFGSPCWGLLLKKRFLWWACANVFNDHLMAPLDASAGESGPSALDARLTQLFGVARGELSDGGTPLAVLWGLLDLQININVLFDHVAFRGGPAVGISGLSLWRDGRLDLGRDHSGPRRPRILTDVLLRNIGDHFEPITWTSLRHMGYVCEIPPEQGSFASVASAIRAWGAILKCVGNTYDLHLGASSPPTPSSATEWSSPHLSHGPSAKGAVPLQRFLQTHHTRYTAPVDGQPGFRTRAKTDDAGWVAQAVCSETFLLPTETVACSGPSPCLGARSLFLLERNAAGPAISRTSATLPPSTPSVSSPNYLLCSSSSSSSASSSVAVYRASEPPLTGTERISAPSGALSRSPWRHAALAAASSSPANSPGEVRPLSHLAPMLARLCMAWSTGPWLVRRPRAWSARIAPRSLQHVPRRRPPLPPPTFPLTHRILVILVLIVGLFPGIINALDAEFTFVARGMNFALAARGWPTRRLAIGLVTPAVIMHRYSLTSHLPPTRPSLSTHPPLTQHPPSTHPRPGLQPPTSLPLST